MSVYSYGTRYPWSDNILAPPGKVFDIIHEQNFYDVFSIGKGKPFMITETASTFHTNTPLGPGVGDLAVKASWWRQFITNATFLETHPMLKGICLFEFMKYEESMTFFLFYFFKISRERDCINILCQRVCQWSRVSS
jgi:hypothetical protein